MVGLIGAELRDEAGGLGSLLKEIQRDLFSLPARLADPKDTIAAENARAGKPEDTW